VKNQGSCGSCWAFGSAETVECVLAQKEKKLTALSEQQLVDCVENPNHCGGTGGCDGATVELAWDLIKEKGIAREADYPYTARDGTCKTRDPYTNITSYVNLPSNQQQPILEAVANVAPLAVAVDASNWFGYRSGVFDGCNQKNPDIDHSVQLVGYGTDTKGGDYWLIRNSWGSGYGEKGYIRIKRESGTPRCGTDKKPSDGTGCDDGPPTITVCGTCGILYDALYPII
jgi:cathepsin L